MELKVLVIDDEDSVQSILAAFLNRYVSDKASHCDIVSMGDPVQSLFELTTRGDQYQLILLDVRIPKLSGDEIYSSLEQVNPAILGNILFVTGYPEDLHERFPDKQLNVLQKPFRYASFAEKLDSVLGNG
ncbi:MAG: response regulator [Mariprofundus sp.]